MSGGLATGSSLGYGSMEGLDELGEDDVLKGPWTPAEDAILRKLLNGQGKTQGSWNQVATHIPGRTGKSCRLRWYNQLNPKVSREPLSERENMVVLCAQQVHGNKWSAISKLLTNRTDNAVKNHWHSVLKRRLAAILAEPNGAQYLLRGQATPALALESALAALAAEQAAASAPASTPAKVEPVDAPEEPPCPACGLSAAAIAAATSAAAAAARAPPAHRVDLAGSTQRFVARACAQRTAAAAAGGEAGCIGDDDGWGAPRSCGGDVWGGGAYDIEGACAAGADGLDGDGWMSNGGSVEGAFAAGADGMGGDGWISGGGGGAGDTAAAGADGLDGDSWLRHMRTHSDSGAHAAHAHAHVHSFEGASAARADETGASAAPEHDVADWFSHGDTSEGVAAAGACGMDCSAAPEFAEVCRIVRDTVGSVLPEIVEVWASCLEGAASAGLQPPLHSDLACALRCFTTDGSLMAPGPDAAPTGDSMEGPCTSGGTPGPADDMTKLGPKWTPAEDAILRKLLGGEAKPKGSWNEVAKHIPGRTGKSCRLRWSNQLNPQVSREPFSVREDRVVLCAQQVHGNKWSTISKLLINRTDNAVKNHWHSVLKRRLQTLMESPNGIESLRGGHATPELALESALASLAAGSTDAEMFSNHSVAHARCVVDLVHEAQEPPCPVCGVCAAAVAAANACSCASDGVAAVAAAATATAAAAAAAAAATRAPPRLRIDVASAVQRFVAQMGTGTARCSAGHDNGDNGGGDGGDSARKRQRISAATDAHGGSGAGPGGGGCEPLSLDGVFARAGGVGGGGARGSGGAGTSGRGGGCWGAGGDGGGAGSTHGSGGGARGDGEPLSLDRVVARATARLSALRSATAAAAAATAAAAAAAAGHAAGASSSGGGKDEAVDAGAAACATSWQPPQLMRAELSRAVQDAIGATLPEVLAVWTRCVEGAVSGGMPAPLPCDLVSALRRVFEESLLTTAAEGVPAAERPCFDACAASSHPAHPHGVSVGAATEVAATAAAGRVAAGGWGAGVAVPLGTALCVAAAVDAFVADEAGCVLMEEEDEEEHVDGLVAMLVCD
ncbi:hypothetical protein FOA52_010353 [Chlamydomonas sp. UWO 241]|nr:hypothetical protein FOA52_010353 [Chlamydomonas sp. UWO 241]